MLPTSEEERDSIRWPYSRWLHQQSAAPLRAPTAGRSLLLADICHIVNKENLMIFNRPGLAGAVLQSPPSLIKVRHSLRLNAEVVARA